MSVVRVEKTRNYTVMSNHHLQDRNLSLKAKGLLSFMLSLPDDWNYSVEGLACFSADGRDAVASAVRELMTRGYVERRQLKDELGRMSGYEYVVREVPLADGGGKAPDQSGKRGAARRSDSPESAGSVPPVPGSSAGQSQADPPSASRPPAVRPPEAAPPAGPPSAGNPFTGNRQQQSTKEQSTEGQNTKQQKTEEPKEREEPRSFRRGEKCGRRASPPRRMGAYGNVLLSDDDIGKLKSEFPSDWRSRIETLSEYIACSGKRYENHLAVIRRWARIDAEKERAAKPARSVEDRYAYSEEDVL